MYLTESQKNALLDLGDCAAGHEFVSTKVLRELLALDLVYWRKRNEIDFTPAGVQVYNELSGVAETAVSESHS